MLLGCGFNSSGLSSSSAGSGPGGDDTSGATSQDPASTGTGDPTGSSMSATTSMTTSSMTSNPTTTTPDDTTDSDPSSAEDPTTNPETTDPTLDTSTTDPGTEATTEPAGESSSTGDPALPYYVDCDNSDQCGPNGTCVGFDYGEGIANICYVSCDLGECPVPESGTADPICIGVYNGCGLDCGNDAECPGGMECYYLVNFGVSRCAWP